MESYKWAGQTVKLTDDKNLVFEFNFVGETQKRDLRGKEYEVQDYWIILEGQSWNDMAMHNGACRQYALRIVHNDDKLWDERVLYGKIDNIGYLLHEIEIKELVE